VTAELREVPVTDLRGMPTLPSEKFDRRLDRLRTKAVVWNHILGLLALEGASDEMDDPN
jgi:hypothetical protein